MTKYFTSLKNDRMVVFTQAAAGTSRLQLGLDTTRYCKYSQVLLMMGENIAQNM
jgi:hypothetical protein